MNKVRLSSLIEDNRGIGAARGLLLLVLLLGFGALAVEAADEQPAITSPQATADAAAQAGSTDLPDAAMAGSSPLLYEELSMSAVEFGAALRAGDVDFGRWDPETETFVVGVTRAIAERLRTQRSAAAGGTVLTNFRRSVGLGAWESDPAGENAY